MRVRKEQGFTLIELLIVVAIVSIIASIAVPGLQRARMSGNEASAIGSMRAINSAEAAYAKATGGGGFATSLVVLGAVCPGGTQAFISRDLALDPSRKSGYDIVLRAATGDLEVTKDCNGASARTDYFATATPLVTGSTGQRSFSTGLSGTIRFDNSGVLMGEGAGNPLQ
jgi:type IV pilus assembly protein PilA